MAQWIKVVAVEPLDLNSILESMWQEERINSGKWPSDLYTQADTPAHTHISTPTPNINK